MGTAFLSQYHKTCIFFQVMVFLWFWLFFLLILSTGLFPAQTRAQSVLQLYRQVFLSILACSSSHRVLLSGDFESQALNYHPPSKHDHDVLNLWTNSTKLRLRNYFLSFAVGARPKNF